MLYMLWWVLLFITAHWNLVFQLTILEIFCNLPLQMDLPLYLFTDPEIYSIASKVS